MANHPHDPRDEAEKARAALARNAELGLSVPESPLEQEPSVTPQTFGDTTGTGSGYLTENDRARVGPDGETTGEDMGEIGDSTGSDLSSRDIPVGHHSVAPPRQSGDDDEDILSRSKE